MSRETSCPSPEALADTNLTDDATAFEEFDFTSDQMLNDIFPGVEAESDDPLLEALTLPSLDGLSHDHSFGGDASVNVGTPPDPMTCKSTYSYTTPFSVMISSQFCPITSINFSKVL